MCRLTKYVEEKESFYPISFNDYEEWKEFLDSIDVVDYVNIATCIDELGEYEDKKEKQLQGYEPKVKITEEDRNFGNVTFKKGVHIYFCGHCGSVVSRIQKYCSECGNKIIWNKQDKERSWKEEILEKFNRRY